MSAQKKNPVQQITADGYVRRCPVQPLSEPADYRRRLVLRVIGAALLLAAALIGLELLSRLGFFGR